MKKRRRASADTEAPQSEASNMWVLQKKKKKYREEQKGLKHVIVFARLNVRQLPLKAPMTFKCDETALNSRNFEAAETRACSLVLCATSFRDSRHDAAVSHRARQRQSVALNLTEI